jgi:ABC-type multidrug transport system fused ATPase/permease subunit
VRAIAKALPASRRREALVTFALLLIGALAEVASLGAVLPFLAVLIDLDGARGLPILGDLIRALPPGTDLIAAASLAFVTLLLISGALRLYLSWRSVALVNAISYDLTTAAFRKVIRQPYPFYLGQNSSGAIASFDMISAISTSVLQSGVQALIAVVTATVLMAALLVLDPVIASGFAIVMIGTYVATSLAVRQTLDRNSRSFAQSWTLRVKGIQEAIGGIRNILLDRSQRAFEARFERDVDELRRSVTANTFIAFSPRIVMEVVAVGLIAGMVWYLASQPQGLIASIPKLGALAAVGQRLLPLLQTAYYGWSQMRGSEESLRHVVAILELPEDASSAVELGAPSPPFSRDVEFVDVSFRFLPQLPVLRGVSITIAKGERIGIAGPTGSGKSTLIDLLLGLLEPSEGELRIDGRPLDSASRVAWQRQVAHVPQSIFLADDTLAANIAFGVTGPVDPERIAEAARSAGIHAFIAALPEGYQTRCGERGIRLSGGQRQRIGIARALYKQASFLVLDEATSALDTDTEREVISAISGLSHDITVVMVAHRLSTLVDCDRIFHLNQGAIVRTEERTKIGMSR